MQTTTLPPLASDHTARGHSSRDATARPPRVARTWAIVLFFILASALLGFVLFHGIVERANHNGELAAAAVQAVSTPPRVFVVRPAESVTANWSLPGTTQAMQDAIIYARVSGYLSKRYIDIGDTVKAGQLLAEIDSPELDQQLTQARANLLQATKQLDLQKANLNLAKITMDSYVSVLDSGAVTKIAVDQTIAAYHVAEANVAAAQANISANEANVKQFEAMTAFKRVLAPFDGVVTQRNVDIGALITAGSPISNNGVGVVGGATGLFQVSQIDTLRVFVSIPQGVARNVTVGITTQVTVRGSLNTPVAATVTRTSIALDPGTRTLLTEVDIPNASHAVRPGEFVNVGFQLKPAGEHWIVPATALVFNSDGTQVMVVDPGGKLRIQKVTVGRDFGDRVDIQAGLNGDETIVRQPDVSLQNGQVITPVKSPE